MFIVMEQSLDYEAEIGCLNHTAFIFVERDRATIVCQSITMRRNRLFVRLQSGIFVLIIVSKPPLVVTLEKFVRWKVDGLRMVNVDATFYNRTVLQCAFDCIRYPGCVSFNRHTSGTCQVNTNTLDFYTTYLSNEPSWNLYERGNCGLGTKAGEKCIFVSRIKHVHWSEASQFCALFWVVLAKISDGSEMQAMNEELNKIFYSLPDWGGLVWLGLSRAENGDFVWTDTSPLGYDNFAPQQPDAAYNCVALTNYQSSWYWRIFDCASYIAFVCERRNI